MRTENTTITYLSIQIGGPTRVFKLVHTDLYSSINGVPFSAFTTLLALFYSVTFHETSDSKHKLSKQTYCPQKFCTIILNTMYFVQNC